MPINGNWRSTRCAVLRSTSVDKLVSGSPDRPPVSLRRAERSDGGPRQGRVADDDAVHPEVAADGDDVVEVVVRRIGRDLDHQRHRLGRDRVLHALQQVGELRAALQVAQARRVGRGDVADEIVGIGRERGRAGHVVGGAIGAVLVGADIDADEPLRGRALQPREGRVQAVRRESPCG